MLDGLFGLIAVRGVRSAPAGPMAAMSHKCRLGPQRHKERPPKNVNAVLLGALCVFGVPSYSPQSLAQRFGVEFTFPAGYYERCHTVADHINGSAKHAHETVDAENESHPGDGDRRDNH